MSSDDGTSNKRKRCDYLRELQPRNESDPKELWESISPLLLSHSLVTKWTSWDDSIRPICVPPPTDFQIPSAKRPFPDGRMRTAKWECWPIYTANLATTTKLAWMETFLVLFVRCAEAIWRLDSSPFFRRFSHFVFECLITRLRLTHTWGKLYSRKLPDTKTLK